MTDKPELFGVMMDVLTMTPGERVDKDTVRGITVSTVCTSDYGYETAMCDCENVCPVERYKTKELAVLGHMKWLEVALNYMGEPLIELEGLQGWCEEKEFTLEYDDA